MNNLLTRTITGIFFIIAVVGSAMWDTRAFALVIGVFLVIGLWEFYHLSIQRAINPYKIFGLIYAIALYLFTSLVVFQYLPMDKYLFYYITTLMLPYLFLIYKLFSKNEKQIHDLGYTFLGVIYLAIPFSCLLVLSNFYKGKTGVFTFPILFFFLLWTYDTFAYIVGITLGKHKLLERVSPKKTWEGAIGGFLFTIILSCIFANYFTFLTTFEWIGLALIIVITGTIGDLLESVIKRKAGVKDSGKFFPGHGGVLDRFDSVLFSAPFVYIYLKILSVI